MYLFAVWSALNHTKEIVGELYFDSSIGSFFFERVMTLQPHMVVQDSGPREPWMRRWCEMMVHEGGGIVGHFFTQEMLYQWRQLLVVVEDYPYAEMDYQWDPEMAQPPGQA